jgi:PAT family beta-lactamase induction signal transducer AmpG
VATLYGWSAAFVFSGVFLFLLVPLTLFAPSSRSALPAVEPAKPAPVLSSRFWFEGYRTLIERPGILWVLLFVLTYKLGTATSGSMILPFWADRHYTPAETGIVSGAVGALESIAAPLAAAWFISRVRLFNALWIFAILQILPGLVYGAVAHWDLGRPAMYAASLSQSFDLSLANLAFTSFLMMICDKKYAATQYAFLSCIFALTRSLAGWMGGITAGAWGFAPFFLFTFFLGFVAFAFLPWVKRWIETTKASP